MQLNNNKVFVTFIQSTSVGRSSIVTSVLYKKLMLVKVEGNIFIFEHFRHNRTEHLYPLPSHEILVSLTSPFVTFS